MSTLWTPDGERPVGRERPEPPPEPPPQAVDPETAAEMEELRQQLADTPAEVVIANHAFGMFELAALHLSLQPPQLEQAKLAIDAFAALVEGLTGRMGEFEPQLRDGLAQLRLAYVQISGAASASSTGSDTSGSTDAKPAQ
jgi:hypothetical protein